MWLAPETVAPACVRISYQLIKICGSLHITDLRFFADDVLDTVKVLTAVQHISEFFDQLIAVFADAIKQI